MDSISVLGKNQEFCMYNILIQITFNHVRGNGGLPFEF